VRHTCITASSYILVDVTVKCIETFYRIPNLFGGRLPTRYMYFALVFLLWPVCGVCTGPVHLLPMLSISYHSAERTSYGTNTSILLQPRPARDPSYPSRAGSPAQAGATRHLCSRSAHRPRWGY
jgi:hypothetical protein